jgi:ADP-ribose pyrophosphatase YjhB (NUDIX family)
MRVKARAVVVRDGRLLVSRERRRGRKHVLLPGGRVKDGESITEALVREVGEETGIEINPIRLLYVAEVIGGHSVHDLNLVWLAEPRDPHTPIPDRVLIDLNHAIASTIMPPIIDVIADGARNGWPESPQWLGNVRRSTAPLDSGRV